MEKNLLNSLISGKIKSSKDIAFLCIAFLLSAATLYIFTRPEYLIKLSLEKQNASKRIELSNNQELLVNIQNFNKDNDDAAAKSKKLAAFIPSRDNSEDFFIRIKDLAKDSNLEISSFTIKDVAQTGTSNAAETAPAPGVFKLNEREVSFTIKGDFDNIISFSKALENGIPFVQEDSIEVGAERGNSSNLQKDSAQPGTILTSNIDFKYYYY